ncbi:MAG: DUF3568 family protein [Candidatus Omnitrophica bacterium]|nr:DUF3568 family protein [Candidatus Omnitrophota bacterium]
MKKSFVFGLQSSVFAIFSLVFCLFVSGCALFLIGGGVAGGLALSKDRARMQEDVTYNRAWAVTRKVIDSMGVIIAEDKTAGKIQALVQEAKVVARIKRITKKATQIDIKARKNLMPNIDLAVDISNKIMDKL